MNPVDSLVRLCLHALTYLFGLVPRECSIRVANLIGDAWYLLDKRHREMALGNLAKAYANEKSDSEIRAIARRSFGNMALIPFDIGWSMRMDRQDFFRHCKMVGLPHLVQAHAKGKGVLILTLHIGSWELMPMCFLFNGFNSSMVYRPLDFAPADQFIFNYRSRHGARPIPKKKSMRKVLEALKRQDCVGILLDQNTGSKAGVLAEFFHHPASTNKGMALLAQKTQAPVVPVFLIRKGMGFEAHIEAELPLIQTGHKEDDIQTNTLRYNQALEEIIRRYPEQWLWMHRRWKKQKRRDSAAGPIHDSILRDSDESIP